jgi:hypothetical protein
MVISMRATKETIMTIANSLDPSVTVTHAACKFRTKIREYPEMSGELIGLSTCSSFRINILRKVLF